MRLDLLDYDLPPEQIAQAPSPQRELARLLALDRRSGAVRHGSIPDLVGHLQPGDVLVVNDTRVRPCRLTAWRATGGRVELLVLEALAEPAPGGGPAWLAQVKAGGTLRTGEELSVGGAPRLRLLGARGEGRHALEALGGTMGELLDTHGRMPLPPYIRREDGSDQALDRERYQTVYAAHEGAAAAPTAGLHLTQALLEAIRARGVVVAPVTLHVGLGTFEPVRVDDLDDHVMHREHYDVPAATAEAVRAARARGGRVVAVGTTSVRTLEAAAAETPDGLPRAGRGHTGLLIQPGYRFRAVDALLTNFHLPRSTLLALVAAFAGREAVLAAYREAVARRYRFFSYGDAMWIA
ncbi:MAG: tRNA preQ1(34) S-adenosylmethionine ribosyltransferase-isomerase QueA [Planctomycetota bacterium]